MDKICPRCKAEVSFETSITLGRIARCQACDLSGEGHKEEAAFADMEKNYLRNMTKPGGISYYDGEVPPGRTGIKYIETLPEGEQCVSMIMFEGTLLVATTCGVYRMVDRIFEPVKFAVEDKEAQSEQGI